MGNKWRVLLSISIVIMLSATSCITTTMTNPPSVTTVTNEIVSTSTITITTSIPFPSGTDLQIETVATSGDFGGQYSEKAAQIGLIQSAQTIPPNMLGWMNSGSAGAVQSVDYSQYFAVVLLNGYRTNIVSRFEIRQMWQIFNTIYIVAHFNDYPMSNQTTVTMLPATNSEYQIVKVKRATLIQFSNINFVLLDETGIQRAAINESINK